jgi:hypothetical protein
MMEGQKRGRSEQSCRREGGNAVDGDPKIERTPLFISGSPLAFFDPSTPRLLRPRSRHSTQHDRDGPDDPLPNPTGVLADHGLSFMAAEGLGEFRHI